jgi:dienelactone hydrolase
VGVVIIEPGTDTATYDKGEKEDLSEFKQTECWEAVQNFLKWIVRDGDARLNGFLAIDADRAGKRPGVLVVHGGAGLDDHARGRARRFAEWGYVVFACDMYGEGVTGNRERIMRHIDDLRNNRPALVRRVQPAIEILSSRPDVDGRIAAVGYCFGGMIVLQYARSGSTINAVVSVHGSLETTSPAEPSSTRARILVCHGALDPHVPMSQITAFAEEMKNAGADYQLIVYGNAMHGFTHETATGSQPGVLYHAQTDARSSVAIQDFLRELFRE